MAPTNAQLLRYYNEASEAKEARQVEAWLSEDAAHLAYGRALRDVVEAGGDPDKYGLTDPAHASRQADSAWARLRSRLDVGDLSERGADVPSPRAGAPDLPPARRRGAKRRPTPAAFSVPRRRASRRGRPKSKRPRGGARLRNAKWRSVAARVALALILVAGGVLLWHQGAVAPEEAAHRLVQTESGRRATLNLSDGTTVQLAPGSELRFPEYFPEGGVRRVRLTGEAFFEVERDETRPFLVTSEASVVKVLGTAFNVRARPEAASAETRATEVQVTEGRVALQGRARTLVGDSQGKDKTDQGLPQVVLAAGDVGRLTKSKELVAERGARIPGQSPAWTRGMLAFEGAPLVQVADDIERWYGVEVSLENASLAANRSLTAAFSGESASEVVRRIAYILDIGYDSPKNGRFVFRSE